MNAEETPQQRLARHVRTRRRELDMSVRAAAKAAGVDRGTWTGLEEGTRATQDRNYAGIERTLQWQTGTIEVVLTGVSTLDEQSATGTPEPTDDEIRAMDYVQIGEYATHVKETRGEEAAARWGAKAMKLRLAAVVGPLRE